MISSILVYIVLKSFDLGVKGINLLFISFNSCCLSLTWLFDCALQKLYDTFLVYNLFLWILKLFIKLVSFSSQFSDGFVIRLSIFLVAGNLKGKLLNFIFEFRNILLISSRFKKLILEHVILSDHNHLIFNVLDLTIRSTFIFGC